MLCSILGGDWENWMGYGGMFTTGIAIGGGVWSYDCGVTSWSAG